MEDFSKAALLRFLDMLVAKGIVNANTGGGWKAACNKVLEDLDLTSDVRDVDVPGAVVRYNNRHPGELSPSSLKQYEVRTRTSIKHFKTYVANPAQFRLNAKPPKERAENGKLVERKGSGRKSTSTLVDVTPSTQVKATITEQSLAMPYPLRTNFLAQIVIPRDLTKDEAKRLNAFIDSLAQDKH